MARVDPGLQGHHGRRTIGRIFAERLSTLTVLGTVVGELAGKFLEINWLLDLKSVEWRSKFLIVIMMICV
jgi:hypothetical protein